MAWSDTPPSSQMTGYTPWIKDPGYDFASIFYDYLKGMIGKPMPGMGGGAGSGGGFGPAKGPGVGGRMKNYFNYADRYMDTGMPTVFGQATGAIGSFLAPQFANPMARLQMGAPNMYGTQALPDLLSYWGGNQQGGG